MAVVIRYHKTCQMSLAATYTISEMTRSQFGLPGNVPAPPNMTVVSVLLAVTLKSYVTTKWVLVVKAVGA